MYLVPPHDIEIAFVVSSFKTIEAVRVNFPVHALPLSRNMEKFDAL